MSGLGYDPDIDVKGEIDRMLIAVTVLAAVDLEGIVAVVSRTDALGPFLDPTAYRDQLERGDMHAASSLAGALMPAVALFREKIEPKLPPGPVFS